MQEIDKFSRNKREQMEQLFSHFYSMESKDMRLLFGWPHHSRLGKARKISSINARGKCTSFTHDVSFYYKVLVNVEGKFEIPIRREAFMVFHAITRG